MPDQPEDLIRLRFVGLPPLKRAALQGCSRLITVE